MTSKTETLTIKVELDTSDVQAKLEEINQAVISGAAFKVVNSEVYIKDAFIQDGLDVMNSSIGRGSESAIANAEKLKLDVDKLNARISEAMAHHDDKLTNRIREVIKAELRPGGLLHK